MRSGEKVYVLTCGSYSDYMIVDVFSTEDKANAYLAAYCDRIRLDASKEAEELKEQLETGSWRNSKLAGYYEKYPGQLEKDIDRKIKFSGMTDESLTDNYNIEEYWLDPRYGDANA